MRRAHIYTNLYQAIQNFEENTCLRFVPYDGTQPNYILFDDDYGCSSRVGVRYAESAYQKVSLADGCNNVGTIIHELMHAIGFFHEQSRKDRNSYVMINWDNILEGLADQFHKYSWITLDDLGKLYDYQSIMHYDRRAFTKNGLPTIEKIGDGAFEFGPANQRLSQKDIIEINALYDCISSKFGIHT
ncbi:unnamed protein product [Porites evermanni]|uniref:Metalloendopeptidase n=1 Tax=Porites evermanni TaxID=104178 RepID=A0ABN8SVY3_9CNID|nr:unnamed protein product [Porites evermanni]